MKRIPDYEEAKRICKMTDREVEMAKRLHVSPETLIRNELSGKYEKWKDQAALFTRRKYEEVFEKEKISRREAIIKIIGKKDKNNPLIRTARRLGFTKSECFMARTLGLSSDSLQLLERKGKQLGLSAALLVRRMYERQFSEKTGW